MNVKSQTPGSREGAITKLKPFKHHLRLGIGNLGFFDAWELVIGIFGVLL